MTRTKKKAKKKTKSKARTKTKTIRLKDLSEADKRALLHQKIFAVQNDIRIVKCSEAYARGDESIYYAVPAAQVFKRYGDAFRNHGLTFTQTQVKITEITGLSHLIVLCEGRYKITDIDTGYSEIVAGAGLGDNEVWSANSAQTVARKQAILNAFNASYPQPGDEKEMRVRDIMSKLPKIDSAAIAEEISNPIIETMRDFFEKYPSKK